LRPSPDDRARPVPSHPLGTALVAVLLAPCLSGCITLSSYYSERSHDLVGLPQGTVDADATDFTFSAGSPMFMESDIERYRSELVEVVQSAVGGGSQPVRFRVRSEFRNEKTWFFAFPCFLVLVYLGCPVGEGVSNVTLDLEAGGRRYTARQEESVWSGLYYNNDNFRAATARALGSALERIAEQASGRPTASQGSPQAPEPSTTRPGVFSK
jgi:hypothetical protein